MWGSNNAQFFCVDNFDSVCDCLGPILCDIVWLNTIPAHVRADIGHT